MNKIRNELLIALTIIGGVLFAAVLFAVLNTIYSEANNNKLQKNSIPQYEPTETIRYKNTCYGTLFNLTCDRTTYKLQ